MRNLLPVSLLIGLLPLTAQAAGETVPCPLHKADTWYRFAKTDVKDKVTPDLRKIESVDGERLVMTRDGHPYISDKMTNWQRFGERIATPKYYLLPECPFALGETRVYTDVEYDGFARGSKGRGTFTVTVDPEFVSLTVKAGSFKVVKIVSENAYRSNSGWNGKARFESYYAPEIGMWVKSEFTETLPFQNMRDRYELLEYSLGQ